MSDAADRLARSRLALIEYVHRRKHGGDYQEHRDAARAGSSRREAPGAQDAEEEAARKAHGAYERARSRGKGWLGSFKRAAGVWWRHHPAHMGVEIVTPLLSAFAGRRPVTYLGAAAVLGAVIVVARPWRLISATGLVVALLKSGQISSMVMSAISAAQYEGDDLPYR